MIDTIAPVKKAKYKPITIFGKPRISPIKNEYFTSPQPIPFPEVTVRRTKKNKKAPNAENK